MFPEHGKKNLHFPGAEGSNSQYGHKHHGKRKSSMHLSQLSSLYIKFLAVLGSLFLLYTMGVSQFVH